MLAVTGATYIYFVHKSNENLKYQIERLDELSSEIDENNRLLAESMGFKYEIFFGLQKSEELYFGKLIKQIDTAYYRVAEFSGGLREGYLTKLHLPNNTAGPKHITENTDILSTVRSEFSSLISSESDKKIRSELIYLNNEVFGKSALGNSAAEFKLRCHITINKLLMLELQKNTH